MIQRPEKKERATAYTDSMAYPYKCQQPWWLVALSPSRPQAHSIFTNTNGSGAPVADPTVLRTQRSVGRGDAGGVLRGEMAAESTWIGGQEQIERQVEQRIALRPSRPRKASQGSPAIAPWSRQIGLAILSSATLLPSDVVEGVPDPGIGTGRSTLP